MSPEQAKGEDVTSASDVWAFGAVMYEMYTGSKPFAAEYDQLPRAHHQAPTRDALVPYRLVVRRPPAASRLFRFDGEPWPTQRRMTARTGPTAACPPENQLPRPAADSLPRPGSNPPAPRQIGTARNSTCVPCGEIYEIPDIIMYHRTRYIRFD